MPTVLTPSPATTPDSLTPTRSTLGGKPASGVWTELHEKRRQKNQKQVEAAAEIGVSQAAYSGWESCSAYPEVTRIRDLAAYMEQSPEIVWLMVLKNFLRHGIRKTDTKSD